MWEQSGTFDCAILSLIMWTPLYILSTDLNKRCPCTYESFIYSWNWISPSLVSTLKSGKTSPRFTMTVTLSNVRREWVVRQHGANNLTNGDPPRIQFSFHPFWLDDNEHDYVTRFYSMSRQRAHFQQPANHTDHKVGIRRKKMFKGFKKGC